MKRRLITLATATAGLLLAPGAAQAHLVVTGMGPVYDGVTHFALSPEDSLPVIALAFYAGLRGPASSRVLLLVLPAAWFVGGLLIGLSGVNMPPTLLPAATAVILLGIGGLLAANLQLRSVHCALVAAALGLVRGAADLAGAPADAEAVLNLVGMCASVFALYAVAASITLPLRRFWMIVATRVAGSWIAAVGLLLAGWIIRYGARVQ
jgi:hydrogenase/urease accessory protein HupE